MNIRDDYSLTARVGPDADDESDIEMRSEREKYTVASDVHDWIAPLFVASPDLLKACVFAECMIRARNDAKLPITNGDLLAAKMLREAIDKAQQVIT